MSRVNRPDTLHTELRELRRRIRLLESSLSRTAPAAARRVAAGTAGTHVPVPALVPARPRDWWPVDTDQWGRLAVGWLLPGTPDLVLVLFVAAGEGSIRTMIDGEPFHDVLDIRVPDGQDSVQLPVPSTPAANERELSIEARGSFRLTATLRLDRARGSE